MIKTSLTIGVYNVKCQVDIQLLYKLQSMESYITKLCFSVVVYNRMEDGICNVSV
jgi:hypothetical protein